MEIWKITRLIYESNGIRFYVGNPPGRFQFIKYDFIYYPKRSKKDW